MSMRQTLELLRSLGGEASIRQMRLRAKELGYSSDGIYQELRNLRRWYVVEALHSKGGRFDDTVWKITGNFEFNVISPEIYHGV